MSMKEHDLPAVRAVPQSTASTRASLNLTSVAKFCGYIPLYLVIVTMDKCMIFFEPLQPNMLHMSECRNVETWERGSWEQANTHTHSVIKTLVPESLVFVGVGPTAGRQFVYPKRTSQDRSLCYAITTFPAWPSSGTSAYTFVLNLCFEDQHRTPQQDCRCPCRCTNGNLSKASPGIYLNSETVWCQAERRSSARAPLGLEWPTANNGPRSTGAFN